MTTFANGESGSSVRGKINAAINVADRIDGYLAVTASASSTILTNASAGKIRVTGSTTQTIVLPVASTLYAGWFWVIKNDSTGSVTVQSSGLNTVVTIPANTTALVICILASGTTAASWISEFVGFSSVTGTGAVVRQTSPSILTSINDSNNNELISFSPTASAVNQLEIQNAATAGSVRIGTAGSDTDIPIALWPKNDAYTRIVAETATTNAIITPLRIEARSTGTPAAGIGVGTAYLVETAANNFEIAARLDVVSTDVTATSEDFDMLFKVMTAGAAPAEVARLTSTKYLRMASGTLGIQFGGDTAAANALDDYEEGTWTPALTAATVGNLTVAYSTQSGTYTKIGDTVFFYASIVTSTFTHTTASGAARISGLPFTPAGNGAGSMVFQRIAKASYTQFAPVPISGASYIEVYGSGTGVTSSVVAITEMPTAGTVSWQISGFYKV